MIRVLLLFIVALVAVQLTLSWWFLSIAAFVCGWALSLRSISDQQSQQQPDSLAWYQRHWGRALNVAVLAGLVWLITAIYLHSTRDNALTGRMAEMLGVGQVPFLFVLTFGIAFIAAFLPALAGSLIATSRQHRSKLN